MKSIIDALFDGKILPYEQIGVSGDEEYDALNQNISEKREYFKSRLTEEDCKRLEALDLLYEQSASVQDVETFRYGFRLGVLIMAEVFTGKDLFTVKGRPGAKGE